MMLQPSEKCLTGLNIWSFGCMMLEVLLPILPQAFSDQFGRLRASAGKKSFILALVDPLSINWHVLMDFFPSNTAVHMKAYVRLCSMMLAKNPVDRSTAQELLLDATFFFVTSL
jgi:serine/threonine protein kinase